MIPSAQVSSLTTGSINLPSAKQPFSVSQPFSMTLTTAKTLYVADGKLDTGTYTITNSTTADSYIYFNDINGLITTAKITAGTSGSVTLSRPCSKVAAHASVNSLTISVGTSPVSITTTAVTGGTLDTISSTTNTYAPAAGWAFVFAVGAASGPAGGDTQYSSYGGSGGFGGLHDGIYTYLNGGNYTVSVGSAGNSGGVFTAGNAGGNTSFSNLLSVDGSRYDGVPIAGNRGISPGGGGGNSWVATPGTASSDVYSFAKAGTNGSGGGGNPGYSGPGRGSGIGTGGFNGNAASGYGAGGGGGNAGGQYGGASTGGVVYVLRGIA